MRSDPSPVKKLTLPEMGTVAGGGVGPGVATEWNEKWRFTVRAICEAKGVVLEEGHLVAEGEDGSESD